MAKKGARLREFEKNHRVLDISTAQKARKKKKAETAADSDTAAADSAAGKTRYRFNWIRITVLAVLIVFILMVILSVNNIYSLKEEESQLKQKNEELLQLKEELMMELDNVNSREYIEEQARKQLKLVKGNELIFFFPDDWEESAAAKEKNDNDKDKDE